jgi:two-component system chemotaxis response regulator CheY
MCALRAFGVKRLFEWQQAARAFATFRMTAPDGVEFLRLVRSSAVSSNPRVPIILLAFQGRQRSLMAGRDAGVTEILVKPVTGIELFSRIHSIVYSPRPFIAEAGYFGPCRRREGAKEYRGIARRKTAATPVEKASVFERRKRDRPASS